MKTPITILFILIIIFPLLFGCAQSLSTPSPAPTAISTQTLTPMPSPTLTATPWPYKIDVQLDYTIVYENDDLVVREGYINDAEVLANLYHPNDRIKTSVQTFNYYDFLPPMGDEKFSKPILDSNGTLFQLDGDFSYSGGNIKLMKNGRLIWSGILQVPIGYPIGRIRFFDDEIAFDYVDVMLDADNALGQVTQSIVYTQGNTAIDVAKTMGYESAFAPFSIGNKLAYIATLNTDEHIIVFNSQEIKLGYTFVHNDYMGDAVSFSVRGNGEMIDFYAKKGDAWYHVQAGSPDAFSHP